MTKVNHKAFKNARKTDAINFLNILTSYSISYSKSDYKEGLPENLWGYKIEGLTIPVETSTLKHIRPEGFSNAEVIVELDVESSVADWNILNDPFTNLSFRSHLKGTNPKTGKVHYLSFHIDRHNGSTSNELHPLYHLQYLQNARMKEKNEFDHGDSMQLDVPRMMHMPLELILGVSLMLSNYSPTLYNKLIQDRQFIKLCKEYQERVWQPYVYSLANFWATPAQSSWDPKLNCPYLL